MAAASRTMRLSFAGMVVNVLARIVGEDNSVYIYYAFRLEPERTKEVLEMAGKQSAYQKSLERIVKVAGTDLLPFLSKDDILKQMTPEDLVRGLSSKEQLSQLDDEEQKRLKQLLQKLIENKAV